MTSKDLLDFFLSVVIVGLGIQCLALNQEIKDTAATYENRLEIQQSKYEDEIIDLKQKLYGKSFELDMATNHIELLNADNGASE